LIFRTMEIYCNGTIKQKQVYGKNSVDLLLNVEKIVPEIIDSNIQSRADGPEIDWIATCKDQDEDKEFTLIIKDL